MEGHYSIDNGGSTGGIGSTGVRGATNGRGAITILIEGQYMVKGQ